MRQYLKIKVDNSVSPSGPSAFHVVSPFPRHFPEFRIQGILLLPLLDFYLLRAALHKKGVGTLPVKIYLQIVFGHPANRWIIWSSQKARNLQQMYKDKRCVNHVK